MLLLKKLKSTDGASKQLLEHNNAISDCIQESILCVLHRKEALYLYKFKIKTSFTDRVKAISWKLRR